MSDSLTTHEVTNQPPPLGDLDLFTSDRCLREAVAREGADWAFDRLRDYGTALGSAEVMEQGRLANRHPPELQTHDRFGHRIDAVTFHPAWHEMMRMGMAAEQHALPWNRPRAGAHVARAAMTFLMSQVEAGCCCPLTMTFAALPALRRQPDLAAEWEPRIRATAYDPRPLPPGEKTACTLGMAMTEKQGGSDVRGNSTAAEPAGGAGEYLLTGHKWFCSAPMSDGFLTLAQLPAGLTCFLVARRLPDGTRNRILLQRLKDKLGNRSNASSEIEYDRAWARQVGEAGRGIATIIEMVHHTRLDVAACAAALMRQALIQATHHAAHRTAFQRRLIDQPLMRNVLADLTLESEAATLLVMRVARSFDGAAAGDESEAALGRLITALAKFWICKRAPGFVFEAMECHGGNGYVEDSPLPRLYREAPLGSIWEGCGNVICLDILRTLAQQPASRGAFFAELGTAAGMDAHFDRTLAELRDMPQAPAVPESGARGLAERMALALQAALLLRHADPAISATFCRARLNGEGGQNYGTLPSDSPLSAIIGLARPEAG